MNIASLYLECHNVLNQTSTCWVYFRPTPEPAISRESALSLCQETLLNRWQTGKRKSNMEPTIAFSDDDSQLVALVHRRNVSRSNISDATADYRTMILWCRKRQLAWVTSTKCGQSYGSCRLTKNRHQSELQYVFFVPDSYMKSSSNSLTVFLGTLSSSSTLNKESYDRAAFSSSLAFANSASRFFY